ncbi:MAG: hypothetical protein OEM50_04405 [Gammaproteobacteria bacterium]|nr:hypothetical protein [Gammaproteobacteria bacterium]MDH3480935.1 hypothetical protein [Gammaproteobacteria bacterium]
MAMHWVDMKSTGTFKSLCTVASACLILAACASRPELMARSAEVPSGADLSGLWQLRDEPGSKPMPRADAEPGIRIPPENRTRSAGVRRPKRAPGADVTMFLESGESLKISQTPDGLFISFDRAIVEEYTFGENRIVSVGPIEAQRVSGWKEQVFVVETLDEQGVLLTESWHIEADGALLVREISVTRGDNEQFSTRQRFDRT